MTPSVPKLASWLAHSNRESVQFHGVAVIVDIAGFTALTERLSILGKSGAETVSLMLSTCFSQIIQAIHAGGGDILQFAGDSILAVFPDTEKSAARQSAETLERAYAATSFVDATLKKPDIRISAAAGRITLTLHSHAGKTVWIAGGSALETAYGLSTANSGGANSGGANSGGANSGGLSEINYNSSAEPDPADKAASAMVAEALAGAARLESLQSADTPGISFFDADLDPRSGQNEFRNVLTLFAKSYSPDTAAFIRTILECGKKTGGDARYFDDTEKGVTACIFFGYPRMPEDPFLNAARFMREAQEISGTGMSFGAAYGTCYAGTVGSQDRHTYTCIGPSVNLACRLMQEAEIGAALIPKDDSGRWRPHVGLIPSNALSCKGIKAPVSSMKIIRHGATAAEKPSGTFIGRAEELAKIASLLQGGQKALIEIHGPPGIGKSRLILEAAARANRKLATVCPDPVTKASLSGFAGACASLLRSIGLEGYGKTSRHGGESAGLRDIMENTGMASREISALAAILAIPGHEREFLACPESGRADFLANGFAALVAAANRIYPIVLLFDDMHEYSEIDIALARNLASREHEPPVQIFCASRSESLTLASSGETPEAYLKIELRPLSPPEGRELAESLCAEPIPDSSLEKILAVSQGDPLFIEQLMRYVTESPKKEILTSLPGNLHDLVTARIDALSRNSPSTGIEGPSGDTEYTGQILRLASILGNEFEEDEITLLTRLACVQAEPTLPVTLAQAEKECLISARGDSSYLFKNTFIRDLIYGMILGDRLKELHALALGIVEASAARDDSKIPLIVYHGEGCGQPDRFAACLRKGMRWAAASWRNDEALAWAKKLLAVSVDISVKAEASLVIAQTLAHIGRIKEADIAFDAALEIAGQYGDSESITATLCDFALLRMESGEIAKAKPLVDRLAAMSESASPESASRLLDTVSMYYYYVGDLAEARRIAQAQLEAATANKAPLLLAKAYANMAALSLADQKDYDEPLRWLDKELAILQDDEDLRMLEECYYYFSVTYHRRNEFKLALQYCNAHMDCAVSMGDSNGFLYGLARRGNVKVMMERYGEGIEDFTRLQALASKSGNTASLAAAHSGLGNALFYSGKPDDALPHYLAYYKLSRESGNLIACSVAASAVGRVYHERGETKKALAFFGDELKRAKDSGDALGKGLAYGYIGMALGDDGNEDKALECIDYAISVCSGYSVPCRLSRLYLEKARFLFGKRVGSGVPLTAEDSESLTDLCKKARDVAKQVNEPIVVDIPWKSKVLEARITGPDSMAKLLASVPPNDLRPTDAALYHYEMSLLEPDQEKSVGHLASARRLDARLVKKYSQFYERIGLTAATG